MNLEREDKRIYKHLATVGSEESRTKVKEFQIACFENRKQLLPLLKEHAKDKKYDFKMGFEKALDLNILEYSFAFWQWGNTTINDIPNSDAKAEDLFAHLAKSSPFTFFDTKGIKQQQPFFYQALTELGMYSYEVAPFKKYINYDKDLTFDFTLPEGADGTFNPESMIAVNEWLQTKADKMLFIYGEFDTWSATQVDLKDNTKCKKFVNPKGAHGTRMRHFTPETQAEMVKTLEAWLDMEIDETKLIKK
jgi:hypothetical protein